MTKPIRKGAEEARSQLPELLTAAQQGRQTIITRHGRPVAVLAPVSALGEAHAQRSLLPLASAAVVGCMAAISQATPASAERRMEPVSLEGLPENALLLIDSAPIIYVLEDHPEASPRMIQAGI